MSIEAINLNGAFMNYPVVIESCSNVAGRKSSIVLPKPIEFNQTGRSTAVNGAENSEIHSSPISSPLLCRKDAARYLGLAVQTLAQWAYSGQGQLPMVKIGRKALYKKCDLDAYIAANTQGGFHA